MVKIAFNIPLDQDNFSLDDLYIMVYSLPIKDTFNIIGDFYYIPKAVAKHIMDVYGQKGELRDHIEEIFKEIENMWSNEFCSGVKQYTNIYYLYNLFKVFKTSPTLGKLETNEYDIKIYDDNMNVVKNKTLVFC